MQSSQQPAYDQLSEGPLDQAGSRRPEDLIYQAVTIAVILMFLGTLWVF